MSTAADSESRNFTGPAGGGEGAILLNNIIRRGAEVRTRLREFLARHGYKTDTKTVLVIGLLDQALEHHEAIWLLRERKLSGSAVAMVRLVIDAMLRALWINACATPEQVEQAANDELDWLRIRLRADIRRAYFDMPGDAETVAERTGASRPSCYRALKLGGRFSEHLQEDGGKLTWLP